MKPVARHGLFFRSFALVLVVVLVLEQLSDEELRGRRQGREARPKHNHRRDNSGSQARRWAKRNINPATTAAPRDRKSTRLNSSHTVISYAVFCLKKKKKQKT